MTPPKIHCNDPRDPYPNSPRRHGENPSPEDGIFAIPWDASIVVYSICGNGGGRVGSLESDFNRGTSVPPRVFRCLPRSAQCGSCRRRLAENAKFSLPAGPSEATSEQIAAVEYGLVLGSRHWATNYAPQVTDHITITEDRMTDKKPKITYADLKNELDKLNPEQLAMPVIWSGDERGGHVRSVHVEPEDIVGLRNEVETWIPRSEVGTAAPAEDYADATICVPAGTVSLIVD